MMRTLGFCISSVYNTCYREQLEDDLNMKWQSIKKQAALEEQTIFCKGNKQRNWEGLRVWNEDIEKTIVTNRKLFRESENNRKETKRIYIEKGNYAKNVIWGAHQDSCDL